MYLGVFSVPLTVIQTVNLNWKFKQQFPQLPSLDIGSKR